MKKRIEITIETDRMILIGKRRLRRVAWCAACAQEVRMVSVDEAAAIAHASSRMIYQRVEAGTIHFTETPEGWLLICLNSLS
jgi:hypothetical protein